MDYYGCLADVYYIDKKNNAVIFGKNHLDCMAYEFLERYYFESNSKPEPFRLESALSKVGLTVEEVEFIDKNTLYECSTIDRRYLIEFDEFFDPDRDFRKKKTLLLNKDIDELYDEFYKRQIITHALLIFFHVNDIYTNFMYSKEDICFECPEGSDVFGCGFSEDYLKYIVWNMNHIAPRVLMPVFAFTKKAEELIAECDSCDLLICELADFFKVTERSVRYRLLEVGFEDKIKHYSDFDKIYKDFEFVYDNLLKKIKKNPELEKTEDPLSAYKLAERDFNLMAMVHKSKEDENFFNQVSSLINSSETNDEIQEKKSSTILYPSFKNNSKLKQGETEKSITILNETYDISGEMELEAMLGDPRVSLCECLWFIMNKQNCKYPKTFVAATELHINYFYKIKNNDYNNMTPPTLMAICVGLKLSLRITEKLFGKTKYTLNHYEDPDMTYIRIMESMPGLSIIDFNLILEQLNLPKLETTSKK